MCVCVCESPCAPHEGLAAYATLGYGSSNALICLAKKVDHGARGAIESRSTGKPNITQEFQETPDTVATVIFPLAKRYLKTHLGCWCKLDFRNPDRRKSQLV